MLATRLGKDGNVSLLLLLDVPLLPCDLILLRVLAEGGWIGGRCLGSVVVVVVVVVLV